MVESAETQTGPPSGATIGRVWLEWNRPLLRQAASWLLDQAERTDGLVRLDRYACVTPGRRAGRVLLEETLRQCEARRERMLPFRPLTPGAMVDALITHDPTSALMRATDLECEFAWIETLKQQSENTLRALLTNLPAPDDRPAWQALARTVHRLHRELTGQRKTFADAVAAVEQLGSAAEQQRWAALSAIARDYHAMLAALPDGALVDPDIDRERAAAEADLPDDTEVILIGVTELNQVQRTLITRIGARATALIHAPEAHAAGFDAMGCVLSDYWSTYRIELDDSQIIVADQPSDQAQQVLRELAKLSDSGTTEAHTAKPSNSSIPVDHVTVGVEDASLSDQLERAASWASVHVHRAEGEQLNRTAPYRLLEQIEDWLEEPRFTAFAALLRHPDVEQWLHEQLRHQQHDETARSTGDWLTVLDTYFAKHLQDRLTGSWLGKEETRNRLKLLHTAVNTLLQPLRNRRARPVGEWAVPILNVLADVYAPETRVDDRGSGDRAIDACRMIRDALIELTELHPALHPKVRSHEAVRMVLDRVGDAALAMPLREDQIESLGWLELHADPAPALILMGVNDGTIPTHITGDPFLPDALRRTLRLVDNAHRYARDAYRLEAINRSREKLVIITGRRSEDGEPLSPSRLLLGCERHRLPGRVRMLMNENRAERWPVPIGMQQAATESLFLRPEPPDQTPEIKKMSVTSFRNYLACPYRFWLRHVLKLEPIDDAVFELDALNFGSFAHDVLERFGKDETIRESTDAETIRDFLRDTLNTLAARRFGSSPTPAVRIQLDRITRRLDAFAERQAAMRQNGWRIRHSELELPATVSLDLPDQPPMQITGTIDRIDENEQTGGFRIIDYKTSTNPSTPFEQHHGTKKPREEWVDLQLPLYRYLVKQIGISGTVEVGYIVLPRDPAQCDLLPGKWSEEQFDAAIEEARRVVRNVRAGEFWPPNDHDLRHDDFANICQSNTFGRDDFGDHDDEGGDA